MNKVFFAASVAALAISAPAAAGPFGHGGGGGGGRPDRVQNDRGGQAAARADRQAARPDRQAMRVDRQAARPDRQAMRVDRQAVRVDRQAMRPNRQAMRVDRQAMRPDRQAMRADRQAMRVDRQAMRPDRNAMRADRLAQVQARIADRAAVRDQLRAGRTVPMAANIPVNNGFSGGWPNANGRGFINGCPPGLAMKNNGCLPPGQAKKLVGSILPAMIATSAMPGVMSSLYPDTSNYYYRYNDGYMYRVNRGSNLVDALLPLLGGGYQPGQYLPNNYMNSYVPSAYSSFYPNYGSQCTRYAYGVVYTVDCGNGLIDNVMPLYDNGYGVGQMLPSSYSTYNVPSQYRDMYYNSGDTGYWYAPGAIYQYDQQTSLITSVAALLAPGMSIGQPLPMGYDSYNVPLNYRDTYYDTPNAWYRYNNGNIYQVDPATQLVTALVASALT